MPFKPEAPAVSQDVLGRHRRVAPNRSRTLKSHKHVDVRNPRRGMKSVKARTQRFAIPGKSRAR